MVDLVKQSMAYIWATSGDIVAPDVAKIQSGWAVETVPRQWWNWMQNRVDNNVAYLLQKGFPEWDADTEYIVNKSYVQYQNVIYKCIQTNSNQEPPLAPTYWVKAFVVSTAAGEAVGGVTPAADTVPYFTSGSAASTTPLTAFARSLLDDPDAATARTTLSAQAANIALTAISGVTPAANQLPYFTGTNTAAITGFTAFARSLLDDADAVAARTTLGLGSMATQNANSVAITGGTISGITDLAIADGGTGASDAAGARTNLGLGTAATATLTTSNQDFTPGRVVKIGDFGFGSAALTTTNFDTLSITGTYQGTDAVGAPTAGVLWIVQHFSASNTAGFQVASRANSDDIRYRTETGGAWSAWVTIQHSGNQLALGTTAASARAALGLANSATIAATTSPTPNTIVLRDGSGALVDSVDSANRLATPRNISLDGVVAGSVAFDGSADVNITTTISDSGALTPTLVNSFVNEITFRYRKIGGIVYVTGTVSRASPPSAAQTITTLPAGFRPAAPVGMATVWRYNNLATGLVDLSISPAGVLSIGFLVTVGGTASGAGNMNVSFAYPAA